MPNNITVQDYDGEHNYVITMNNRCDGSGDETLVTKVDVSTLIPNPGDHLVLWHANWVISGGVVNLYWAGTPNRLLQSLSQVSDDRQYSRFGGIRNDAVLATGDVLLSTIGFVAGSSYTITLEFKKDGTGSTDSLLRVDELGNFRVTETGDYRDLEAAI